MTSTNQREYLVWSTYKVTGEAYVKANSAAEAVAKALNAAEEGIEFVFSEAHSETKMQARLVRRTEATPHAGPPQHIGNRANAEDCPACVGLDLPYPFICPGEEVSNG